MLKNILTFFGILLLVIIGYLAYYGFFDNTKVYIAETGGEYLVYEQMKGDYSNISKIIDKIYYSLLNNEKIETYRYFGIYYSNPKKVKKVDLISEVGSILEKKDENKIGDIEKKYNIKQFPRKEYIVSEFPIRGGFSYILGTIKIYPALNNYAKEKGFIESSPVMEIYDIPNQRIIYRKEIILE